MSDVLVVYKVKRDGSVKRWYSLNLRSSGASSASSNAQRVILPGGLDVVWDCLELLSQLPANLDVALLVLDFLQACLANPLSSK